MAIIKRKTKKTDKIVINSDMMKIVIASHFRYKLKYKYTCTEYQFMDVCACNNKRAVEIEVKISKADLLQDGKKHKHPLYKSGGRKRITKLIPNYFYYAITQALYEDLECLESISNLNPNYGIIVVSDWREPEFKKRAKTLHKLEVQERFLAKIIDRISSENICLRKKLYELKLEIKNSKKKDTL